MLKKTVIVLAIPLLSLLIIAVSLCRSALGSSPTAARPQNSAATAPATGTLQKMIVENGTVTMALDLNWFSGAGFRAMSDRQGASAATLSELHFAVVANSFLPVLVFNDLLRGLQPGSMALIPQDSGAGKSGYLPAALNGSLNSLVVEKLPSTQGFDFAVRDSNTGFTFFNVEGHQYDYDPAAQSLAITNGRLLGSKELANALGRPSDGGAVGGKSSIGAAMQPIQIDQLVNGETRSMVMPPVQHEVGPGVPNLVPGPDVIIGDIEDVDQMGSNATQVGLAIGTDSCNNGDEPVDWFAL